MNMMTVVGLSLLVLGFGCTSTKTPERAATVPPHAQIEPTVFADPGLALGKDNLTIDITSSSSTQTKYPVTSTELKFTNYTHNEIWNTGLVSTTVSVSYPLLDSPLSGGEDFSKALFQLVIDEVDGFRSNVVEMSNTEIQPEFIGEYTNMLNIKADIVTANPTLISAKVFVGFYYAGAAHPNSYTRTLNFDLNKKRALALSDVFKPNTDYLKTISVLTRSQLLTILNKELGSSPDPVKGDDEMLVAGTTPDAKNFANFTLEKGGIRFLFNPYDVAPYSFGPQQVFIPFKSMSAVLEPTLSADYHL